MGVGATQWLPPSCGSVSGAGLFRPLPDQLGPGLAKPATPLALVAGGRSMGTGWWLVTARGYWSLVHT